jgi:hypothetical protein
VTALIVLASIVGFVSVFSTWVKRQALETDTWTATSSQLLEDRVVREAVADFVVAQLFESVDVQDEIATQLPPDLKGLAGPAAGGLRQVAGQAARGALEAPRIQAAWADANRAAHDQFVALLEDEEGFVTKSGGVVTLDLRPIVSKVAAEVGLPGDVAERLPPEAARLEILRSDELETAKTAADLLRTLDWLLLIVVLALFGLAVYLAGPRRREALRAVGIAFVLVGLLTLLVRSLVGDVVVDGLTETAAAEAPVRATWEIATSNLRADGVTVVLYGLLILLGAWLAGPTASATNLRRTAAPYLRDPRIAYVGLGSALVVLFWLNPIEDTRRLLPSLILIGLLVLGVEMLRRQVIREWPDGAEQTQLGLAQRLTVRRERSAKPASAETAASPDELRLTQLERLARLHETGGLTDSEFAAEKLRIVEST